MKLNELHYVEGSRKVAKRQGRGYGSGLGKNGGSGRGQRRQNDHQGGHDIGKIGAPRVGEDVLRHGGKVHIFHHPRDLPDKPEEDRREPHAPRKTGCALHQ